MYVILFQPNPLNIPKYTNEDQDFMILPVMRIR